MELKKFGGAWSLIVVSIIISLLLTSCATTESRTSVWESRIGNYSYNQAVAELGAPLETRKLNTGGTSAEWLTRRNAASPVTQSIGTGFHAGGADAAVGQSVAQTPKNEYLRLAFDPTGKLAKWERVYR